MGSCGWLKLSRSLGAVVCLRRDAFAPNRSAAAQARGRKRRSVHADCKRACIHGSAEAWKCRTRLTTLSARFCFSHTLARLCGQSASWSKMSSRRPERYQNVGSALMVLREAQGRARFHDCQRSALCQPRGETVPTVAVCHSVCGPWGRTRCHAKRVRCACAGGAPLCFACLCATLRRALTRGSGRREAPRSGAPRQSACSGLWLSRVRSTATRARGWHRSGSASKRVVGGLRRLSTYPPAAAMRAQAWRFKSPQAQSNKSAVCAQAPTWSPYCCAGMGHGVRAQ